jgi:uncharacterized membrane protein
MILLILGLAIWTAAHLYKSAAPEGRAAIGARLGDGPARGLFAALIGLGLVLMILGYRGAPFIDVYVPPSWGVHLTNVLMLFAIALFGMGKSKGRARSWFRHPMLMGVVVWAAAHLLVNGDLAALILFGGLATWALVNMAMINARDGAWTRPVPGTASGDLRLVAITVVAYTVISGIHAWLGVWPFPG